MEKSLEPYGIFRKQELNWYILVDFLVLFCYIILKECEFDM